MSETETTYHVDPLWVADRPAQVRRTRIVAAILTIVLMLASSFPGKWFLLVAVTLGAVYWLVELLRGKRKYEDLYVQVLNDGLFQSTPGSNEGKPTTMLTPWRYLIIDGVKRKPGIVETIRLIDKTLPKGIRSIKIEKLERMDNLLSEINSRLQVDSN